MMIRHPLVIALSLAAILSVPLKPSFAASIPDYLSGAVADPSRPPADTARDANRKPAQTLAFADVKPGEKIVELIPGGGYFTRLFSKAVGPKGRVYAWSPPRGPDAPADMPDMSARVRAIAAEPGYSNITVTDDPLSKIQAGPGVGLVFTAQNYHDLHTIGSLDIAAFNKAVYSVLMPGGEYVIVDHSAEPGSGVRDASTLHRIDAAAVKQEVLDAGFVFVAASDILANPDDPRNVKAFDPSVRGKTDQFVLKFRKPKS